MSIENDVKSMSNIDWKKIKDILCGIAHSVQAVADSIPSGTVKLILNSIAGVLFLICNSLPSQAPCEQKA